MKDKLKIRLVSTGFLAGIIFSGLLFLTINSVYSNQNQVKINLIIPTAEDEVFQDFISPDEGKLNINSATLSELDSLPGIGESKAAAIIDFREKYGDFENLSELTYVPGIGNAILNSIQDLVIIN